MKPTLQPGISLVRRVPVGKDKTISFMGEEGRVYATPYLIGDIEHTCRNLILDHAEPDEDSVGVEVAIKHLAPTLLGSTIEIAATVTAVEGRKVIFAVTVKDEIDTISSGSHTRFVVDKAKTIERLTAKAAKLETRRPG
jgi:fluoroacetyl-CoA thioesterase